MRKTKRIIAAVMAALMTMSSSALIPANAVDEPVNVSMQSVSETESKEYTFNEINAMTTEDVVNLFTEKGLNKDNGYTVYGQGNDAEYVYCFSWNVYLFSDDFLSNRTVEEILTDYAPPQDGDCLYDKGESLWDTDRIVSALALPEEYFEITVFKTRVFVKEADSTDKNKIACNCEIRCKLPEGEKRAAMRNAALNYLQLRKDFDKLLIDDAVPYYGKEKTVAQKYGEAIADYMANNDIQGVVSRSVPDEKLSIGFHGDHEEQLMAYITEIGLDESGIPYELEKLPDFIGFNDLNVTTVSQPTVTATTSTSVTPFSATIKGDANCDGQVDLSDAVMIMQALANPNKYGIEGTAENHLTEQGKLNGDMDGDGLTVGDAQAIQRILLGLIDTVDEIFGLPKIKIYNSVSLNDTQYTEMKVDEVVRIKNAFNTIMSNTSGIGILFEFDSKEYPISLSTDKGYFKIDDVEKGIGRFKDVGQTYDIGNGGRIFWNPNDLDYPNGFECEIVINGNVKGKTIAIGKISISQTDDITFSAILNEV